ncbi:hypothetical protein HMPREF0299_6602 [Corynebacterium matruchotii ATCC 14266]|uniref:Uncharacterized protein n=1 Tax=Corynebacterium matruchotii ATCC 14266 TaxID=553207 RepID=E0DFF8_9CORY|nr:hypothetical protein HMPREF0299_6602 [Corynebacterium matruchotii ATCC 14266]
MVLYYSKMAKKFEQINDLVTLGVGNRIGNSSPKNSFS